MNKIAFYSSGQTRVDLVLLETDTVSLKIGSSISQPGYPVVNLTYNPTLATNSLFIQNNEFFMVLNGRDVRLDLINKQIDKDNAQVSFIWKEISIIDYWQNEFWNTFFDANNKPKYQIGLDTAVALLFPNYTGREGGGLSVIRQTGDTYDVLNDYTIYPDSSNQAVSKSFAHNTFAQRNLYAVKNGDFTHSNTNGYWDDTRYNTFIQGDTLTLYDYNLNESDKDSDPIFTPYRLDLRFEKYNNIQSVCQFNQFTYKRDLRATETAFVETIPDAAINYAEALYMDFELDNYSVLIPVQLLPVNIYGGQGTNNAGNVVSDPAYTTGFYVVPLFEEYNIYVRKRWVADLPQRSNGTVYDAELLHTFDYKASREPLMYYQPGMDPDNCMYNIETGGGNWTPVVNPNTETKLSDIISDIIYLERETLKQNGLSLIHLIKMDETVGDTSYELRANDFTTNDKFRSYLEQDGFALVSRTGTDYNYVSLPWGYNCGPQIAANYSTTNTNHHYETLWFSFDMMDGFRATEHGPDIKMGFKNTNNYRDYKQMLPVDNGHYYSFEGYTDCISNFNVTNTEQSIAPTQLEFHGNIYDIIEIKNFNLRNGFISGICRLEEIKKRYLLLSGHVNQSGGEFEFYLNRTSPTAGGTTVTVDVDENGYFEWYNDEDIAITSMAGMFYSKTELLSIEFEEAFNTSNVNSLERMFMGCSALTSVNGIENWNTSNVTDMAYMFYNCSVLTSLDLSDFDTSNVTSMYAMFYTCSALTSVEGMTNWNTGNVTDVRYMFQYCSALTTVGDLSNWDTSNVTATNGMFMGCSALTSLDLSGWNTGKVTVMSSMFRDCSALTYLKLDNWTTTQVTTYSYFVPNVATLKIDYKPSKWNSAIPTAFSGVKWTAV